MRKWFLIPLIALGLVAIVILKRVRLDRAHATLAAELFAAAHPGTGRVFETRDLEGLPPPVQRYLASVLQEGQPYVRRVRLVQRGQFRLGSADTPWKPLVATQHFTVRPPGFVWDATIQMAPLVPVRVADIYKDGEGLLRAMVLATITVAEDGPGPEMNAGELARYLAETAWFPTALLPGEGVEWTRIDDASARATLSDGGTTVSVVFHFNERDEVDRVFAAERPREVGGHYEPTPWTGHFRNYEVRNGMRIPVDADVEWNLPEGDLPYWRGHLDEIEHEPC